MSTPRIVPSFDEVEDGEAGVGLRAEAFAIEQLALERREEALAQGVVVVLDLASGQVVDTVVIKGTSRWATFGSDHPQDLLPEPIAAYVASLFQDRR